MKTYGKDGELEFGSTAITKGGKLKCKNIIYCVTPSEEDNLLPNQVGALTIKAFICALETAVYL